MRIAGISGAGPLAVLGALDKVWAYLSTMIRDPVEKLGHSLWLGTVAIWGETCSNTAAIPSRF